VTAEIDLKGSRAKLRRGQEHVDTLRAKIRLAGRPNPNVIPLRRSYEREYGAVVYRVDRVLQAGDDWGLIVGDAVHNLRSALDHLAWSLAVQHFNGIPPTSRDIVRNIQFPIVSNADAWPTHPHRRHMSDAAAAKFEPFQPFKYDHRARLIIALQRGPGAVPCPLEALARISNSDKHQTIEVVYVRPEAAYVTPPPPSAFTDCDPLFNEHGTMDMRVAPASNPPRVGDEVLRLPVIATGPNPDVDLKAEVSGYVAVREGWDLLSALGDFARTVETILCAF
jgi:hypothetical protein